jgi:hypothetical protein
MPGEHGPVQNGLVNSLIPYHNGQVVNVVGVLKPPNLLEEFVQKEILRTTVLYDPT